MKLYKYWSLIFGILLANSPNAQAQVPDQKSNQKQRTQKSKKVVSANSQLIQKTSRAVSKEALSQIQRKLNIVSTAGGAFVEENGPSWVEWKGEHKKGDLGNVILPATKVDVQRVFQKTR